MSWLFDFSLHAAMLTDLYLNGYVQDRAGNAYRASAAPPDDPVLRYMLQGASGQDWTQLVGKGGERGRKMVCDQLEASGWIVGKQRRTLGILTAARVQLYDEDMVSGIGSRVAQALHNAIDGRPADPRPLGVGLIAVQAQLPALLSFTESPWLRAAIREITLAAIEPILGLQQAIQKGFADVQGWVNATEGLVAEGVAAATNPSPVVQYAGPW